ncbi:MAG: hypothetical protein ABIA63_15440 [bacterium]
MIKLGQMVEDQITGFKGKVMAITEYLHGCRRMGILPMTLNKEDLPHEDYIWMDEPRLTSTKISEPGGPRPDAPSR